jgi:hypothetical protein
MGYDVPVVEIFTNLLVLLPGPRYSVLHENLEYLPTLIESSKTKPDGQASGMDPGSRYEDTQMSLKTAKSKTPVRLNGLYKCNH